MYTCAKCKSNNIAPDEFSCYSCHTCISCGGCDCDPYPDQDFPEAQEMIENEQGFIDNDYGQQSI
jgi:hypothetical protein